MHPAAFHGYGPYHQAKNKFYGDLQDQPADAVR